MGLLGGRKSTKNIKLDDYVENKVLNLKDIVKDNKTLIALTLLGSTYYLVRTYYLV